MTGQKRGARCGGAVEQGVACAQLAAGTHRLRLALLAGLLLRVGERAGLRPRLRLRLGERAGLRPRLLLRLARRRSRLRLRLRRRLSPLRLRRLSLLRDLHRQGNRRIRKQPQPTAQLLRAPRLGTLNSLSMQQQLLAPVTTAFSTVPATHAPAGRPAPPVVVPPAAAAATAVGAAAAATVVIAAAPARGRPACTS